MERVTKGVIGAKRPALVTTLARKTVLHSLELEHVPNCDTMQQGVAVVNSSRLDTRADARHLAWSKFKCFFILRRSRMKSLQTLLI